ncbi:MAG: enoyl-CoA hydratase/isomerase family protein [Deltaproteobacteria bacterium HGW-Deltaproteobacteria-9]|nr:MAG: enoyl-CoA hydratase/isomerase family protein [Deltaproteobacteria bacterium HGW-Deltaproteobacteria-9]
MPVVKWKKDGAVAIVSMSNSENRINPVFNREFLLVFDEIAKDKTISAVVICSDDEKNWCQGIDLRWMQERLTENDKAGIKNFIFGLGDILKRVLFFPMPVIAAISGHAVAGGVLLACACDFRFMSADKGFFFLSEVDVGVPFLPSALALVRKAIPEYQLCEIIYTGKRYRASELEPHHILKACADKEALMSEAMAFARTFNKKRGIFGELKKCANKNIADLMAGDDLQHIEDFHFFVKEE